MLTVDIEKLPSFKRGLQQGIEEGIEEGIRKTMKLSVKAFHSLGYEVEKIAKLLNLTEQEVKEYLQ